MENQGKRKEQIEFSEKLASISLVGIFLTLLGILFLANI